jgi:ABC-type lipoprotein export system ATPase subunit
LAALRARQDVAVIGVTDYLSIANYERLLAEHAVQPLGGLKLLVPNIELRVTPQTAKGHAINLHLLVDPSDPNHPEYIKSALARLSFRYNDQPYSCARAEMAKLGRSFNKNLQDEVAQYSAGVELYKIEFSSFCDWLEREEWLRSNSLVAAAGGNDGPSGLSKDSGWAAVQEEIWRYADIVFSGNPQSRSFWLLEDPAGFEKAKRMGAPKPCVHGCDAHDLARLFEPAEKRYCWVKADPTFEGLRQILYEPAGRLHIGPTSPGQHDESQVIESVRIFGGAVAAFDDVTIPLNDGLVAIIGTKGSGKSALTDLMSFAAGVEISDKRSFLLRARDVIDGTKIQLRWADGKELSGTVGINQPKKDVVRYLSQSFVEQLCSDDYQGSGLTEEIENVIFRSLDPTDTLNASSFKDLRELRTKVTERERIELSGEIKVLIEEDERLRSILRTTPEKKKKVEELGRENEALQKQLPTATSQAEIQAQDQLVGLRKQLLALQSSVATQKQMLLRIDQLNEQLGRFRETFHSFRSKFLSEAASLGVDGSLDLQLSVSGESSMANRKGEVETQILKLEKNDASSTEPNIESISVAIATAESAVAADQVLRAKIQQIQKKMSINNQEIQRLQMELLRAEGEIKAKIIAGREERLDAYEAIFRSWKREQAVLESLYEPVQKRLASGDQEERNLDFYMRWDVDLDGWLERGNQLFDSRKAHPFGGPLRFREIAEKGFLPAWSSGDPDRVRAAMDAFLTVVKDQKVETFLKGSVGHALLLEWILSYSHIRLTYGLRYNHTELEKLSPGTRGIVLLILYLAMDTDDNRPLLVDQPEENLDSDSVYSLLSKYFRNAKLRRQVIVITHNPNLVVNTDADQIIVASADRQLGIFPSFSYISGSLEDAKVIRERVCSILEGGPNAFLEREKRYALQREERKGNSAPASA